jgi:hypothetical protein
MSQNSKLNPSQGNKKLIFIKFYLLVFICAVKKFDEKYCC